MGVAGHDHGPVLDGILPPSWDRTMLVASHGTVRRVNGVGAFSGSGGGG